MECQSSHIEWVISYLGLISHTFCPCSVDLVSWPENCHNSTMTSQIPRLQVVNWQALQQQPYQRVYPLVSCYATWSSCDFLAASCFMVLVMLSFISSRMANSVSNSSSRSDTTWLELTCRKQKCRRFRMLPIMACRTRAISVIQ